jgi:hypothetical protein
MWSVVETLLAQICLRTRFNAPIRPIWKLRDDAQVLAIYPNPQDDLGIHFIVDEKEKVYDTQHPTTF